MTYEFNDDDYNDKDDLYYFSGMLYDLEDAQELNQKMNGIIMNENNNIVSLSEYIEDKFEGVLF
jgi:hypothetical protein|tara:strand:+ start:57 stop:248 length:192 start_codon:yes stop_codon:yes gene_type:complete